MDKKQVEAQGIPTPMSLEEAAAYLKMTPAELRRRTQAREQLRAGDYAIPFYKIGRCLWFTRSSLAGWVIRMRDRKPVFFQSTPRKKRR